MAEAVKPGRWLLIQQPHFHLAPTTEPEVWADTWRGLIEWGQASGQAATGRIGSIAPMGAEQRPVGAEATALSV